MAITLDGTTGITASGNITGNYILGNGSQLSGIISSVSSLSNGSSNVAVAVSNGNVTVGVGGTPSVAVFSTAGANVAGTLGVTGNITGGNLSGTNIVGTLTTAAQTNITSVGTLDSLSVTGNANVGNLGTAGNITASYFFGNGSQLSGIDATGIQSGTSNVKVVSSGGNVTTSVGGQANVLIITSTGANIAGTLNNGTGNANLGNVGATNVVATNLTGTLQTATQTGITSLGTLDTLSVTGNITGGNLLINTDAVITGNLTVQGNTTTINSNVITTNDLNITVGNNQSTGSALNNAGIDVGNNNLATWRFNNATTSWQSNIAVMPTANGTLTLGGTSNYWGAAYVATLTATGNANVGNLGATTVVATTLTGTLSTAAQTNITSVGTLDSLSVTGNITGGNVNATLNGSGANITSISATNISSGTLAQARLANASVTLGSTALTLGSTVTTVAGLTSVTSTTFVGALTGAATTAGTVTTAAQGNITSVGTLTALTVSGAITVNSGAAVTAIVNGATTGVGNIGSSTVAFNTVFAKATTAQYADLAEKYTADAKYAPGTVVMFGGNNEVTVATEDSTTKIAGVISTNPGFIMNEGLESAFIAVVALQGRVPCQVVGPVRKGDMMVAAGNGAARAENNPKLGTVIGKSLEDSDLESNTIEVAVGRL